MTIPDFQTLMRPTLDLHIGGEDLARSPLRDALAEHFRLSDDERAEMLPSGRQRRFDNRLAWTLTYLAQAGLLSRPRRGVTCITDRGLKVLQQNLDRVDMSVLNAFAEYREFRGATSVAVGSQELASAAGSTTPEEAIQAAHAEITAALAEELLDRMRRCEADFFEQLVIDVLTSMGYGGSAADAAERLGRSNDEGIDGVIREDPLGLDAIYVQAKKWDPANSVGRPALQAFVGALQGARASKGVFITTSSFSPAAIRYVESM